MKRVLKFLKRLFIVGACLMLLIQIVRPARTNPSSDPTRSIEAHTNMTPPVAAVFARACNDCHTNKTDWPWYTNVAPVSWFVINHVNDGRRHMNFSDWARLEPLEQRGMLKQICREVKSGGMPLTSYIRMHGDAKLSDADVKTLCDWAEAEQNRLGAGREGRTSSANGN